MGKGSILSCQSGSIARLLPSFNFPLLIRSQPHLSLSLCLHLSVFPSPFPSPSLSSFPLFPSPSSPPPPFLPFPLLLLPLSPPPSLSLFLSLFFSLSFSLSFSLPPRSHYIDQAGFEHTNMCLSASQVLNLMACATTQDTFSSLPL